MALVYEIIESLDKLDFELQLNTKVEIGWLVVNPLLLNNDTMDIVTYRAVISIDVQLTEPI